MQFETLALIGVLAWAIYYGSLAVAAWLLCRKLVKVLRTVYRRAGGDKQK